MLVISPLSSAWLFQAQLPEFSFSLKKRDIQKEKFTPQLTVCPRDQ